MGKNDITFSLHLMLDGKEHLVTAATKTKELQAAIDRAKTSQEKFNKSLFNFNQAASAISNINQAMSGLSNALGGMAESYRNVEMANTRLATVMQERMNASQQDVAAVQAVIKAQTQLGIIGGSVQKAGAQQVATFLTQREALITLIPAINNLVAQQKGLAATEQDAQNIGNLFGKVMQGQTSALKRVGITFNEAQEKVLKMGTEQERAAMLAEVVTANVGHMNQALGDTAAGSLKQFQNRLAGIKVKMGEMANTIQPYLSMATSVVVLASSAGGAVVAVRNLATALNVSALGSKLAGIKAAWLATQNYILTGSFTAEAAAARLTSASLYGTAAAATVAKVALRGLLVSTGVGAAMAALGFVIEKVIGYFDSSTTAAQTNAGALADNEQATKKLSAAKQLIKDVQADAATRYQAEIQKVQELTRIIRSNTATYADRQAAIKKLQGIIPSYQASIAKDGTLYEKNATAVDKYIRKLNALAMAEAMRDKLKPYYAQLADIRIAKAKAQKQVQNTRQTIAKANGGKSPEQLTREYAASDTKLDMVGKSNADIARRSRAALGQPSQRDKNEPLISAYNQQVAVLDQYTRSEKAAIKVINEALGSLTAEESQSYTDLALGKPTGITPTTPTTTHTTTTHTTNSHTNTTKDDKPAPQGSLEWYDEAIRKCDNYIKTATDATAIQQKLQEKATLQHNRKALAIKLGIEQPDKADTTDALDKLKAQLAAAQADSAQATTIAAKVRAEAKVSELQSQIDAETARRLTLTAIVNPQQAAQQAAQQRRTDYQGASQQMSTIQADFDNGLISQDEALRQVDELNTSIKAKLGEGVKPFKLEVDTDKAQTALKDFKGTAQNAWSSLSGGVDAVMNLTDTLKGNGSAWEKMSAVINTAFSIMSAVSGVMEFINLLTGSHTALTATDTATTEAHTDVTATDTAVTNTDTTAKAGNAMAGAAKGGASLPFPANIAAIAAGVAAVVAVIAMIGSLAFEHGGIVPGTSLTGDRVTARVNSGEMIINRRQQLNLWRLANTRIAPPQTATPATLTPATRITPAAIAQLTQPRRLDIAVTGRIAGRDIKLTLDKRNTLLARS